MTPDPVLVTSANGKTGRAVVAALAKQGCAVRAFLRREAQYPDLRALGAESCAVGDLGDADSLVKAAAGCAAIVHIGPPMHPSEFDYTANALAAARAAEVEHFVYYSVMHPLCSTLRHHGLKLEAERHVIESGMTATIVQPIRYMQHLEPIWNEVVERGVHAMPFSTTALFNVVDVHDVAEAVARVVIDKAYRFGCYELAGAEALDQVTMAAILSEELGRPVRAEAIAPEPFAAAAAARGVPPDRLRQMAAMNDYYDRHGFRGSPAVLTMLLDRPPTSFRDYVRRLIARRT